MRRPSITVITVVRNAVSTIEKCIRSVLEQGIDDLEYIVVDGQSSDGTMKIVGRYSHAIRKVISEPDAGLYDAMNRGLALATGTLVHFLNADDRYAEPQALGTFLQHVEPSAIYYGQMRYVECDGKVKVLGVPFSWERELRGSNVPQPALFVPLEFYRQVGGFDTSLRIAADYDMVLRLARRFPIKFLPQLIVEMHAGGISFTRPDITFREAMLVSCRHGLRPSIARLIYWKRRIKWWLARTIPASVAAIRHGNTT